MKWSTTFPLIYMVIAFLENPAYINIMQKYFWAYKYIGVRL